MTYQKITCSPYNTTGDNATAASNIDSVYAYTESGVVWIMFTISSNQVPKWHDYGIGIPEKYRPRQYCGLVFSVSTKTDQGKFQHGSMNASGVGSLCI